MYHLDLTRAYYRRRRLWAAFWTGCALLILAGLAHQAVRVYQRYTEPTLATQLTGYEFRALTIERTVSAWTNALALGRELEPFYRAQGAPSMADVLQRLADSRQRVPPHVAPIRWQLNRPGEGRIDYFVALNPSSGNRLKADLVAEETNRLFRLLMTWNPKMASPLEEKLHASEKALVTAAISLSPPKGSLLPNMPASYEQTYQSIQAFRRAVTAHRIEAQATTLGSVLTAAQLATFGKLDAEGDARIKERTVQSLNPGALLDAMSEELRKAGEVDPDELTDARRVWSEMAERRLWRSALETKHLAPSSMACSNLLAGAFPAPSVFEEIVGRFQTFTGAWEKAWTRNQVLGGTVPIAREALEKRCRARLQVPGLKVESTVEPGTNRYFTLWSVTLTRSDDLKAPGSATGVWEEGLAALVRDLERDPRGFLATGVDVSFNEQSHDFSRIVLKGILLVRPADSLAGKGVHRP